mgnify:CR=1 FL=1
MDVKATLNQIGIAAKSAAAELGFATAERKHAALIGAAENVWIARADIIAANALDMDYGRNKGLSAAMLDRLMLDEDRIRSMVDGLRAVAEQEDPVGQVLEEWQRPTGLQIKRVRTPLGVIGVIYESRPNVTADAGALCLKAGNAVILRGGSEGFHSSTAIHKAMGRRKLSRPESSRARRRKVATARHRRTSRHQHLGRLPAEDEEI